MSDRTYHSEPTPPTQLWIYLLPVVGIIPAIWTLYRPVHPQNNITVQSELVGLRQRVSRLSLNLALLWLSSYCLLFFGAANVSGIESFRLLYLNALLTTGYFLTCFFLMLRINKKV